MRKLLIALALGLFCAAAVCAQKKQSDREFEGLKGPVKSVSVERAMLKDEAGRQVEGRRVVENSATYNAEGNRVNDEWYDDGELFTKNVYSYDEGIKAVESHVAYPTITLPAIPAKDGRPAQPAFTTKGSPRPMQRAFEKHKYKYDAGGNIKELSIETQGRVRRRSVFTLKGRRKEMLSYEGGKDLDFRRVETLDAQGNVVESVEVETKVEDGETKYSFTAYESDARGNWVKRVKSEWTTEGGKPRYVPFQVEYRTIVYF